MHLNIYRRTENGQERGPLGARNTSKGGEDGEPMGETRRAYTLMNTRDICLTDHKFKALRSPFMTSKAAGPPGRKILLMIGRNGRGSRETDQRVHCLPTNMSSRVLSPRKKTSVVAVFAQYWGSDRWLPGALLTAGLTS